METQSQDQQTSQNQSMTQTEDSAVTTPSTTQTESLPVVLPSVRLAEAGRREEARAKAEHLAEMARAARNAELTKAQQNRANKDRQKKERRSAYTLKAGWVENPILKWPRNSPCPCGTGKKFKACCLNRMPLVLPNADKRKELEDENAANQLSQRPLSEQDVMQTVSGVHHQTERDSES